ncbi:hypothetical protein M427DRAFT_34791 [Gonapodya prolifera JEL478]|uniref:Uncharacterized protein n=1 Tax=Gonapodya prolifera (strain JEL478) TaxID=1344416 RepID=A0A139A6J2_GONPJ|nr:hypothetical protein M427DRAFT_34791 [Gonapodya prolifera JEL478]|eukprot:KXS12422.1 hypothetical protein M427DRAFT_34791 [Gonapodya prolifera JEL478]
MSTLQHSDNTGKNITTITWMPDQAVTQGMVFYAEAIVAENITNWYIPFAVGFFFDMNAKIEAEKAEIQATIEDQEAEIQAKLQRLLQKRAKRGIADVFNKIEAEVQADLAQVTNKIEMEEAKLKTKLQGLLGKRRLLERYGERRGIQRKPRGLGDFLGKLDGEINADIQNLQAQIEAEEAEIKAKIEAEEAELKGLLQRRGSQTFLGRSRRR